MVFFISAVFHEVLVGVPLHMLRLWAFWGLMMQVSKQGRRAVFPLFHAQCVLPAAAGWCLRSMGCAHTRRQPVRPTRLGIIHRTFCLPSQAGAAHDPERGPQGAL